MRADSKRRKDGEIPTQRQNGCAILHRGSCSLKIQGALGNLTAFATMRGKFALEHPVASRRAPCSSPFLTSFVTAEESSGSAVAEGEISRNCGLKASTPANCERIPAIHRPAELVRDPRRGKPLPPLANSKTSSSLERLPPRDLLRHLLPFLLHWGRNNKVLKTASSEH